MCSTPDAPKIEIPEADPFLAEDQISLATKITEETRRKRLAAFNETIATSQAGVLGRAKTTRTIATGSL